MCTFSWLDNLLKKHLNNDTAQKPVTPDWNTKNPNIRLECTQRD